MSDTSFADKSLGRHLSELRGKWGWFMALGVLLVAAGFIAAINLFAATIVSVYYVGALMLVGGIVQIIHAFGVRNWGGVAWWLLSGILYAAAGVVTFMNPLLASAILTLLIAATLLASGILRAWVGFQSRPGQGWGWIVAGGVITALAGIVIALGWPVNSLFILGIFLAFDLMFQGWGFIAFGLALRR